MGCGMEVPVRNYTVIFLMENFKFQITDFFPIFILDTSTANKIMFFVHGRELPFNLIKFET